MENRLSEGLAAEELFRVLYDELHRLAHHQLGYRGASASFGVTTLLHESYLDLAKRAGVTFPDRARFFRYAARTMRTLIMQQVRRNRASKRGGQIQITALSTDVAENASEQEELTQISEALDELAKFNPSLAELVDLKFFCGFSFLELAAIRGVSERTVQRQWERARIYLRRSLQANADQSDAPAH